MCTNVVNIHHNVPYDVYIGRAGKGQSGYFGNPIRLQETSGHDECLSRFKSYFLKRLESDAEFKEAVEGLRGKTIACFCRPKQGFQGKLRCHGQVIAGYLDNIEPEDVE